MKKISLKEVDECNADLDFTSENMSIITNTSTDVYKTVFIVRDCRFLQINVKDNDALIHFYSNPTVYMTSLTFADCSVKKHLIKLNSKATTFSHICCSKNNKIESSDALLLYLETHTGSFFKMYYSTITGINTYMSNVFRIMYLHGTCSFKIQCMNVWHFILDSQENYQIFDFTSPSCLNMLMNTFHDLNANAIFLFSNQVQENNNGIYISMSNFLNNKNYRGCLCLKLGKDKWTYISDCAFTCQPDSKENFIRKVEGGDSKRLTIVNCVFGTKLNDLSHGWADSQNCEYIDPTLNTLAHYVVEGYCEGELNVSAYGCNNDTCPADKGCDANAFKIPNDQVSYTEKFHDDVNTPTPTPTVAFSQSIEFSYSMSFSLSSTFSDSYEFSQSKYFSKTSGFTGTYDFSKSEMFSKSTFFTKSDDFSQSFNFSSSFEFSKSDAFSKTEGFTETTKFSGSLSFSNSDFFTKSIFFSKSNYFSQSLNFSKFDAFSRTDEFSKTGEFSETLDFSKSKPFSKSDYFPQTSNFTKSNDFSKTNPFSFTNGFTKTGEFSKTDIFSDTNAFSKSFYFTISNSFEPTDDFNHSHLFTPSETFTNSKKFSSSKNFSPSDEFSKTFYFTKSFVFTLTNNFSQSFVFTKSSLFSSSFLFTKSDNFGPTKGFTSSIYFSKSDYFTKTNLFSSSFNFTKSDIFVGPQQFSSSLYFTKSDAFSNSDKFTKTLFFSSTNDFTKSIVFSNSLLFTNSALFKSKSNYFSSTETFLQKNVNLIIKSDESSHISKGLLIGIAILIGLTGLIAIVIGIIFLRKRKLNPNDDFEEEKIETFDDISLSTTIQNPLNCMLSNDDPFEDEFE